MILEAVTEETRKRMVFTICSMCSKEHVEEYDTPKGCHFCGWTNNASQYGPVSSWMEGGASYSKYYERNKEKIDKIREESGFYD